MEYIGYVILGLFVMLLVSRMMPVKGVEQKTTAELKAMLADKQTQFIDVRTPAEFAGNHIKGFRNIPLAQLPQATNSLNKERPIVVICQSGMRSSQASKILKQQGFTHITNIKGGMSAWN